MSHPHHVVLVGHCAADTASLTAFVRGATDGATVARVNSDAELVAAVQPHSLLLVNRVLDGGFTTPSGQDIIERVLNKPNAPRAMLISNYADAQAAATAAGAQPGVGKGELRTEPARQKLRDALAAAVA
jgi:hypothetical protein